MNNRTKNIIYSMVLLAAVFAVYLYRTNSVSPIMIEGNTMGTTYHVTYFDSGSRNFKTSIDSLLEVLNRSISTYLPDSEVSRFNRGRGSLRFELPFLADILNKARKIVSGSGGAFDPTVMPLVNAWGFGPAEPLSTDNLLVDSLLEFVGFEKIMFNNDSVWKQDRRTQLDFGGIGQGYGADVVTRFLKEQGIENMLVEIGGEGMACGKNLKTNQLWQIGILDPNSTRENQFFKAYVALTNRSFTTSGGYFNYREIDGKKFSHTIDPHTGYPANQPILSASVFAADCTEADGWATAFMVMGHERAIEWLKQHPELDALLMFSKADGTIETFMTKGISDTVTINQ